MDHKSRSQDIENPKIKIPLLPKYIEFWVVKQLSSNW